VPSRERDLCHGFRAPLDGSGKEEDCEGDDLMLLELTVQTKSKGRHATDASTNLAKIIDSSGLYHQVKNKGTVLEGSWDQLMAVAKKCHDEVLKTHQKIVTVMRAVDGPEVDPCRNAPGDCAAMKELLEDDGDWMIM
jgi:uncharacterized protein YqgV (UPF0045/DUF77 family)